MTTTATASFRDPENAAFAHEGIWYRVAGPSSAEALRDPRSSDLYAPLVAAGSLVEFNEEHEADAVLAAFARTCGRPLHPDASLFAVESIDVIAYPWEWPNSLLEAAGLLTLSLRERLLDIGLDLKDASAFNVQF